jgi:hypothetical protein
VTGNIKLSESASELNIVFAKVMNAEIAVFNRNNLLLEDCHHTALSLAFCRCALLGTNITDVSRARYRLQRTAGKVQFLNAHVLPSDAVEIGL